MGGRHGKDLEWFASVQKLIGVTNPLQVEPGKIHRDFRIEVGQ
jgi:nucleoside diphosphate kinase